MKVTRRTLQAGISIALSVALLAYLAAYIDFGKIPGALASIPASVLLVTIALLVASTLLGALRLYLILGDVGASVSIWVAARAMFLSSIGGLVFFQVVGQTITRIAILRNAGVPVAATLLASIYERIVSVVLVSAAAGLGVVFLFGRLTIRDESALYLLSALLASAILAVILGLCFAYRHFAGALLRPLASGKVALGIARVCRCHGGNAGADPVRLCSAGTCRRALGAASQPDRVIGYCHVRSGIAD